MSAIERSNQRRHGHDKASTALGGKLGRDSSTVQLHDPLTDEEPQPKSRAVSFALDLVETFEEPSAVLDRNPGAVVQDGQASFSVDRVRQHHADGASSRTEAHRVVE